ncbi:MAG: nucleotidyltransferase domain-containing protein [Muribaculaceae bacterium]|nr:nucleotidyltransferase domain-containing protein [Muribaculaceae bacterium]
MVNKKTSDMIPVIKHYFQDKPVLRAWLFGSYSRGEETSSSDIDILVYYPLENWWNDNGTF